jgi:uncharacterized protein YegL
MTFKDFSAESPENYDQKSICCFVVDVSGSMSNSPINELNKGLQEFHSEIAKDTKTANCLEIAIVEFSDYVSTIVQPALVGNFTMPNLTVKGTTKMVDGVREAIQLVESRKQWYKQTGQPYLRPWIILITDGAPDGDQDVSGLSKEIEQGTKNKNFVFLPIGVQGADMSILNKIAGYFQDNDKNWKKMSAMKLQGLKFADFFKWVSASMSTVVSSKEGDEVNLSDPSDWMSGFKI